VVPVVALKDNGSSRAVGVATYAHAMRMARRYDVRTMRAVLRPPLDDGDGTLHLDDEDDSSRRRRGAPAWCEEGGSGRGGAVLRCSGRMATRVGGNAAAAG
jgi:hypothetical protein